MMNQPLAMHRRDARPAARLCVVLALLAACTARQQTLAGLVPVVVAQAQKEEDTMKTGGKQQSGPNAGLGADGLGSAGAGLPDPGQDAVSPAAAQTIALAQSKSETDHAKVGK